TIARVDQEGVVAVPIDPRDSDGKTPRVRIRAKGHPEIAAVDVDIPVRYDGAFVANYSGGAGSGGLDGMDGNNGAAGSPGSSDVNFPKPGGDAYDGSDGWNGGDGSPGGSGQDVRVWVRLRDGVHPLLQVRVAGTDRDQLFLVDPRGGSLLVLTDG